MPVIIQHCRYAPSHRGRDTVGLGYIPNCYAHPDVGITLAWFKLEIADAEMQSSAHFILLHRICQDQTTVRVSIAPQVSGHGAIAANAPIRGRI